MTTCVTEKILPKFVLSRHLYIMLKNRLIVTPQFPIFYHIMLNDKVIMLKRKAIMLTTTYDIKYMY